MRVVKMIQIENNIKEKRQDVNADIWVRRESNPRIKRTRTRSLDERIALTKITKATVDQAKLKGKMNMIGKRKMYYEPTE